MGGGWEKRRSVPQPGGCGPWPVHVGKDRKGPGAPCHQPPLSRPDPSTGSYVEGIVSLHYKTDESVRDDIELQAWCREITEIGLLGAQDRGRMSPKTPTCDSSLELPQNLLYFYGTFQKHFQLL